MDLCVGLLSRLNSLVAKENNVVSAGTIISILELKKSTGVMKKNGFCSFSIASSKIDGLTLPSILTVVLTTRLRITGIALWKENCLVWCKLLKLTLTKWPINNFLLLMLESSMKKIRLIYASKLSRPPCKGISWKLKSKTKSILSSKLANFFPETIKSVRLQMSSSLTNWILHQRRWCASTPIIEAKPSQLTWLTVLVLTKSSTLSVILIIRILSALLFSKMV